MQVLFLKIFPCTIDTFSTVINRDVNGKKYLCRQTYSLWETERCKIDCYE
ncbi:hypothetical protein BACEGG_03338 [Bacteroides eggerthii DSM 20697]|nr:hypothetical protein BACEGG_03338 [Bacteroides eggerthii DSM 20697]